jgi:hydrogenase nickel incorporation protein HypB
MCDNCGCAVTDGNRHLVEAPGNHTIEVLEDLLHENNHQADHNRDHFNRRGVLAVNLMSSPGSGKTALLEKLIHTLPKSIRLAVIEGDLETENDAERIRRHGVPAVQITTGMACHLDAHMVHTALHKLELDGVDILFIENVGNLVCPANFDLGQHHNVLLLSVTEGDDKPTKYPVAVRAADVALITKTDLLPYLDEFSPARARQAVNAIRPEIPVFELSARSGVGVETWAQWLLEMRERVRAPATPGHYRRTRRLSLAPAAGTEG